jgi:hypothetical protein
LRGFQRLKRGFGQAGTAALDRLHDNLRARAVFNGLVLTASEPLVDDADAAIFDDRGFLRRKREGLERHHYNARQQFRLFGGHRVLQPGC